MVVRRRWRPLRVVLVLAAAVALGATGCGPSQRERELRDSNQQLEHELRGLQNDLTSAQKARDQALADLAKAKQERDAARKDLADAEAHAEMLSQDRDQAVQQLQAAKAQVDTLTKQRDEARAALDQANGRLDAGPRRRSQRFYAARFGAAGRRIDAGLPGRDQRPC